ncbi:DUF6126 family protein [Streptomyces sp. NPDC002133]|uniref:DUF6126 family protein n=1 Tax=Streptomyces sp. NPDC002133 TaxID=3154409 RepID=UPI00331FC932
MRGPVRQGKTSSSREANQEQKCPVRLIVRLFAYVVAGHLFAAFLRPLFTAGAE